MLRGINLENLYTGFINSYNQFLFPAGEDDNYAQETHAIIEYFRRLAINLGYYPYCEYMQRDLEWYAEEDNTTSILHLEAENTYSRFNYTIEKICKSKSLYGIAILWTNETEINAKKHLKKHCISLNNNKKILVIIRYSKGKRIKKGVWVYGYCGYELSKEKTRQLKSAQVLWPDEGFQTIEWEK